MAEQTSHPDPWHDSLTRGYQNSQTRLRWFAVAVGGFIVCAALTHVVIWYMMRGMEDVRPIDRPTSAVKADPGPPPSPPLQPIPRHDRLPRQDLEVMREGEDRVFANLGWPVDAKNHRVTVPDELVRRVAERSNSATKPTTKPGGAR